MNFKNFGLGKAERLILNQAINTILNEKYGVCGFLVDYSHEEEYQDLVVQIQIKTELSFHKPIREFRIDTKDINRVLQLPHFKYKLSQEI